MKGQISAEESGQAQLLESAIAYLQSGNREDGQKSLESIIEKYPDYLEPYGHLAWSWLNANNPERALPLYLKILDLEPENYHAKMLSCQCYLGIGEKGKAKKLADCLDVPLNDAFSLSQMIHLLMGLGRPGWRRALKLAEKSIQEQTEVPDIEERTRLLKILISPRTGWGVKRRLRRLHSFLADPKPPHNPSMTLVLCPRLALDLGYPPIGLGRLAATLTRHQLPAQIIDMNLEIFASIPCFMHPLWDQENLAFWNKPTLVKDLFYAFRTIIDMLVRQIVSSPARLVGFSVFNHNRYFSIEMAKRIRQLAPEKCIIFGGPDCFPLKRIQDLYPTDLIDGFAIGEGEKTLLEIVRRVRANEPLEGIPGLWLTHTAVTDFQPVVQVESVASLALPTYREFKIALQPKEKRSFFVELSRGCIGHCDFCNDRQMWPGFRMGSPEDIARQMKTLYDDFGVKHFCMVDPLVNAHLPTLEKFCDKIIEFDRPVSIIAAARVNPRMTLDFYKKMKKAGFCGLSYGLESGSNKVLRSMRKGIKSEWASQCLSLTRKAGIGTGIFIIVGHPAEGEAEFQETLDFLTVNRDHISSIEAVNLCDLHESSDLTLKAHQYGILDPENRLTWSTGCGNTYEVRCQRLKRLYKHISDLGFDLGFQLVPLINHPENDLCVPPPEKSTLSNGDTRS